MPRWSSAARSLPSEIGASRSEVWRLVQQLRRLGVEIAGHPATGYQLKAVPDLLLPEMLAPAAGGHDFRRGHPSQLHHYYKIGSTNVGPWKRACGRARRQRFPRRAADRRPGTRRTSWHSAQSAGIYCSVILRPPLPPSEALILSLAAGLAVHAAVQEIDSRASRPI